MNKDALETLSHPDNKRFISASAIGVRGLEIGFHIPPFSRGHVITKLGRNTDLILPKSYSGVHVAFEMHMDPLVVMLSVRTKQSRTVTVEPERDDNTIYTPAQRIAGDCALRYGQGYIISITSYKFLLAGDQVWPSL
jgi:hypothetical protein